MFQDLNSKHVHDYSENTSMISCQQGRFFYDVHPKPILIMPMFNHFDLFQNPTSLTQFRSPSSTWPAAQRPALDGCVPG